MTAIANQPLKYSAEVDKIEDASEKRVVALVGRAARNESLPGKEIIEACSAAGWPLDKFRAEVVLAGEKNAAESQLAEAAKLDAEAAANSKKLTAANDAIVKAHEALRLAQAEVDRADHNRRQLFSDISVAQMKAKGLREEANAVLQRIAGTAAPATVEPARYLGVQPGTQAASTYTPSAAN